MAAGIIEARGDQPLHAELAHVVGKDLGDLNPVRRGDCKLVHSVFCRDVEPNRVLWRQWRKPKQALLQLLTFASCAAKS
jgi:hypothetical protein